MSARTWLRGPKFSYVLDGSPAAAVIYIVFLFIATEVNWLTQRLATKSVVAI